MGQGRGVGPRERSGTRERKNKYQDKGEEWGKVRGGDKGKGVGTMGGVSGTNKRERKTSTQEVTRERSWTRAREKDWDKGGGRQVPGQW